jgi:hypothetical protein
MSRLSFFLLLLLGFTACVKNNPDPSWLEVTAWTLQSNIDLSGDEGELSHNITEAWVSIDDKVIGVFQVPFKIPILKDGMCNIKIYPAIKNNGISATKKIYPFLEVYEVNQTLIQNQTLTLNPVTKYKSVTQFWIEDFEDDANSWLLEDDPNTSIANCEQANENLQPFNGSFYGKVSMNSIDSLWVAYTENDIFIAKGKEAYLEIDYHNTNSLTTGLIYVSTSGVTNNINIRLNAQSPESVVWKKIYIELKELITASPNSSNFQQSFSCYLDPGQISTEILIDNIKVVYFN